MNRLFHLAAPLLALATIVSPVRGQDRIDPDLALATFDAAWERVHRTHYDTAFNGVDWLAVRDELRPRAGAADDQDDLRTVLGEMLSRLGESHYVVIPGDVADAVDPDALRSGSDEGAERTGHVGMAVRLLGDDVVVTEVEPGSAAEAAGIRPGWILLRVGDRDLTSALERVRALEDPKQRRNGLTQLSFAANGILEGAPGSTVELRMRDALDREVTLSVRRQRRTGQAVRFGNLPAFFATLKHERIEVDGGCVGFIRMNVWMVPLMVPFDGAVEELRGCDAMIVDLRGNPGGVAGMVAGVGGHFLTEAVALGHMRQRGISLDIKANPRTVTRDGRRVEPFGGPLAILVDEMSVSTSEFFAGGMQSIGRARVFGRTTAGQALPAAMARLPNGDVLMYVVADFTAARDVRIEGVGVIPDVEVPLRRTDLLAGRDAALDAALRWVREPSASN